MEQEPMLIKRPIGATIRRLVPGRILSTDHRVSGIGGEGITPPAFDLSSLIAETDNGVVYRYWNKDSLKQDSGGISAVDTVGQSVGLVLDESKGLVDTLIVTASSWTNAANLPFSNFSTTDDDFSGEKTFSGGRCVAYSQVSTDNFVAGNWYRIDVDIELNDVGVGFGISSTTNGRSNVSFLDAGVTGLRSVYVLCTTSGKWSVYAEVSGIGSVSVKSASISHVAGNHQQQVTATARPEFAVAENGKNCILLDGVDDVLSSFPIQTLKSKYTSVIGFMYDSGGTSTDHGDIFSLLVSYKNYIKTVVRTSISGVDSQSRGAIVTPTAIASAGGNSLTNSAPTGVPIVITVVFDSGVQYCRVNGVEVRRWTNGWTDADSLPKAFWTTGITNFGVLRRLFTAFAVQRVLTPEELAAAEAQVALESGVTLS